MASMAIVRSGGTLAAIAALCTALVAFTYELTDERIAANKQAWLEQNLQPALSGLAYDGNIGDSKATLPSPHGLPGSEDADIHPTMFTRPWGSKGRTSWNRSWS